MSGFRGEQDAVRGGARELDELAGRADRVAEELDRALRRTARCWGDDEIGARFAAVHREPSDAALRAVAEIGPRLRELGGRFTDTAADRQRVDAENAAELNRSVRPGGNSGQG